MTYTGTVVSWHSRKGYGFVECRDFEQDLYVHVSGFGGGELIEGKTISFDVQEDGRDGKKRCVNVEGDAVDRNRPGAQGLEGQVRRQGQGPVRIPTTPETALTRGETLKAVWRSPIVD
ncbi:hypothetical protein DIPPA_09227 [Diplonema papillatum]|nr:hypothetical protein DIPPA_09227 [Diplonema papillatum]